MPKFSDAEKEFIRQKLMQEGERLFVSFGIKKVSIDEIVQATGIAKGSFYSFYQSKEHLYMDIAGNLQMRMWQEMDEFLNENRSFITKGTLQTMFFYGCLTSCNVIRCLSRLMARRLTIYIVNCPVK